MDQNEKPSQYGVTFCLATKRSDLKRSGVHIFNPKTQTEIDQALAKALEYGLETIYIYYTELTN